ncbi:hypothetical protein Lfu02_75290 [Longispora fulva]|nr:hypothetical protein Lfu02_75290 [Longispora fulva]
MLELQRLRKAGLSDLAVRSMRYPHLSAELHRRAGPVPRDTAERLAWVNAAFSALVAELPVEARDPAMVLFHAGRPGRLPPLDDRRRVADQLYTGRAYARTPDTIQRILERDLLDPLLAAILLRTPAEHDLARPAPVSGVVLRPVPLDGVGFGTLDHLRISAETVLTSGTVSPARMTLIEETVDQLRRDHVRQSPAVMLSAALTEFGEVISQQQHRQPTRIAARLSEAAGTLAILAADSLMKAGNTTASHAWYRTARLAADDGLSVELQVQVRAQEAMLPYYYGDLPRTIDLAQEAQAIAGSFVCPAVCLAAAAEARAWARLGNHTAAEAAIGRASNLFDQLGEKSGADAFAFPEKRLLLYFSGALTYLNQPDRAAAVQDRALNLYGDGAATFTLDPTLIHLDRAAGLALRDADGACQLARETIHDVPTGHLTQIVLTRGADVLAALPTSARALPAAADLRALLTNLREPAVLPAGPR